MTGMERATRGSAGPAFVLAAARRWYLVIPCVGGKSYWPAFMTRGFAAGQWRSRVLPPPLRTSRPAPKQHRQEMPQHRPAHHVARVVVAKVHAREGHQRGQAIPQPPMLRVTLFEQPRTRECRGRVPRGERHGAGLLADDDSADKLDERPAPPERLLDRILNERGGRHQRPHGLPDAAEPQ